MSPRSASKPIADCTSWRSVSISSGGRGAQASVPSAPGATMPSTMTATLIRRTWPGWTMRSRRVSETSKFCRSRLWVDDRVLSLGSPPTSPSGRLLATVTPGEVPCAFSELSSTSEEIATRLSGSIVRSVMVWLSISASTLTSTIALPGPTRASSRRWIFARSVSARSLAPASPPEAGFRLAGEDDAARRVDHRHRLRRHARHRRGDEVADRLGLAAGELAARHGDRDRGGARGRARERLRHRVREVDAGGAHVRRAGDGAGELALLGAPVGGVEHLARRAEPRQVVEDLVAGGAAGRQPLGRERHPDAVARRAVDEDRGAVDLEDDALGLELGHNLAGGGGIEAGIEHGERGLGRDPADPEDRRDDREHAEAGDQAPAGVEAFPDRLKLLHPRSFGASSGGERLNRRYSLASISAGQP